ncbi:hypothetical protein J2T56_000780 [Natronobacillus azotifigens]
MTLFKNNLHYSLLYGILFERRNNIVKKQREAKLFRQKIKKIIDFYTLCMIRYRSCQKKQRNYFDL